MKKLLIIFLLVFLAAMPFCEKKLSAKIKGVTVYNDRAMVNREGTITLAKGRFEIYIPNLPTSIDRNSINVDVQENGIKLYNIAYKTIHLKVESNLKIKDIKQKIRELQKKVKYLNNRNNSLQNQIKTLESIKAKVEDDSSKQFSKSTLNIDNLTKTLSFILSKYTATLNAIYDNSEKIKNYQESIQYYTKKLNELTGGGKEERRISITGYVSEPKTFNFKIKYLTYGASWYPTYRVYLSSKKDGISMEYYGVISQRTGEDWKDVALTLSTSVPRYGVKAPIIQPYYLRNITWRSKAKGRSRKYNIMQQAPKMAMESIAESEDKMYSAPAEVVENAYAVEYRSKMLSTIPTTGEEKTIYLQRQNIKGETIYKTVPRMEPKVYAQIKSVNKSLAPILAGKVSVFYGNNFVGDYSIRQILPGEKFKLDLGPVNYFKVKFKLEKRKYYPPKLLVKNKKYDFEYSIKVENLNVNSYQLVVYDRIPVSQDSKIKVNGAKITPEGYELNEKTGIIKWELPINKKEKKLFKIKYIIEIPKNYNVGL